MTLNDELYSRMVNLYQNLDDEKIHQLNARLILFLVEEISSEEAIRKIFENLEIYRKGLLKKK